MFVCIRMFRYGLPRRYDCIQTDMYALLLAPAIVPPSLGVGGQASVSLI